MLIAMIIRTYDRAETSAERHWRRRWALYCLKAERRMTGGCVARSRLGQLAWDPRTKRQVYSHVFEVVEDDREREAEVRAAAEERLKLAEELVAALKKSK